MTLLSRHLTSLVREKQFGFKIDLSLEQDSKQLNR